MRGTVAVHGGALLLRRRVGLTGHGPPINGDCSTRPMPRSVGRSDSAGPASRSSILPATDGRRPRSPGSSTGEGGRRRGHVPDFLRPVYQPIEDLRNGQIAVSEEGIRPLPDSGFADPFELFTAAELAGRTVKLGNVAFLEIVAAGATAMSGDAILTLNMSPRTLEADFSASKLVERVDSGRGVSSRPGSCCVRSYSRRARASGSRRWSVYERVA